MRVPKQEFDFLKNPKSTSTSLFDPFEGSSSDFSL